MWPWRESAAVLGGGKSRPFLLPSRQPSFYFLPSCTPAAKSVGQQVGSALILFVVLVVKTKLQINQGLFDFDLARKKLFNKKFPGDQRRYHVLVFVCFCSCHPTTVSFMWGEAKGKNLSSQKKKKKAVSLFLLL